MKIIIRTFILLFLLLLGLFGCQKSFNLFNLPSGFVASIETVVSPDMSGSFHVLSREIEGIELDLSEPTYVLVRIQILDEITYEGKTRPVRWITTFRFQEGRGLRVLKNVNR